MPTNEATKPSNGTSSSGIVNSSSNENTEGACCDPDASVTCWKPSKDFSSFLEKNFRRKLSYDQVLDVLETNSVSSVDALASPTLDLAIINQISNPLSKKHVQEHDKEIVSVQRSLLNATGPLCCLHDALESNDNINVSNKDVKFMLEQGLCLRGSANYQISVLRRKKECYLGMTFHPSPRNRLTCHVAFLKTSHQMQGATFLAPPNVVDLGQSPCGAPLTLALLPLQSTLRTVQKNAFFVLKGRSNKNQPAPTSVGANNVRSRSVEYCKGLSNRFSFNPSSVLPSCHKGKFFRNPVDRCRVPGIVKERSYSEVSPSDQAFYNGLFLVPKKEGTYPPVIELSSLNRFVPHVHFQIEGLHCLKTLLRKGDYMTSIDLEDTYVSVPIHKSSQRFLRFI